VPRHTLPLQKALTKIDNQLLTFENALAEILIQILVGEIPGSVPHGNDPSVHFLMEVGILVVLGYKNKPKE
jgi:hypothetical protein